MSKKVESTTSEIITKKEIPTITLSESIIEYDQLCSDLESEIIDLDIALEEVLAESTVKLAICDDQYTASPATASIVNINRRLQRAISTLYNIKINLGI